MGSCTHSVDHSSGHGRAAPARQREGKPSYVHRHGGRQTPNCEEITLKSTTE